MNDQRIRTGILVTTLVPLLLLAAACAGSTSTTDEATAAGDEPEQSAAEAAPEPAPRYVTVSLPAGTALEVELSDALSSGTNQVCDPVRARLTGELVVEGKRLAPAGAELRGTVKEVVPLKKFGGQPKISVGFDRLDVAGGGSAEIVAWLSAAGKKQAGRDAAKIGGGAAAGAVIGHQIDDKDGSKIGALVGGAIGTAIAAKTGKEIELPAGEIMLAVLEADARVRVEE